MPIFLWLIANTDVLINVDTDTDMVIDDTDINKPDTVTSASQSGIGQQLYQSISKHYSKTTFT